MRDRARAHAESLGVEISHEVHVPGVFDMGLAIKKLLQRDDVDGVAILGAVIKGDTMHDELISNVTARVASDLALQFDKPVALGVTGPGMTEAQAYDRIDNARTAVDSVARMIRALKEIG
ncbi:MAG: 6,7-dimethyl-8-ribityllumazine synthase [Candidatus Binatales bacterium]